jgi:very-long-chain (3R)-3-hydroxyacyl-CoA dehydratase
MSSSFTWASLFPDHQEHRALLARASTSYADFGDVVRWVQTSALLEVVHVALGFVRSGLGTTGSQVASRLVLVWGILLQFPIVSRVQAQ